MNAGRITRILRSDGLDLFTSRRVAPDRIEVTQQYVARGALASVDTRQRREQRAELAADVLRSNGYTVEVKFDRLIVTAGA